MRALQHAAFVALLALFVVWGGQLVHWYAAALMATAYARHGGRLLAPLSTS